jgi:hypothetical protein
MTDEKNSENSKRFLCANCDFNCSNKNDYNRHISTAKHKRLTNTSAILTSISYECACGKTYNYRQSLYTHKKKCAVVQNPPTEEAPQHSNQFLKDEIIEKLVKELIAERNENKEMKSMFMLMIEKYQEAAQEANKELVSTIIKGNQETTKELVNKFIEIAPKMGNTTNTTNNNDNRKITFNYYLENHCKEAETIHDFIGRYALKCADYFRDNAKAVAERQVGLADNAHRIFFECLRENPQHMNFVQTSNMHDGVHYVKEREHGKGPEYWTLHGDAEFRKYTDKFQKKGYEIGTMVFKVLQEVREEVYERMKRPCRNKPRTSDYEGEYAQYVEEYNRDVAEYNRQYEDSNEYNNALSSALTGQVFAVLHMFDATKAGGKKTCKEIMENTHQPKSVIIEGSRCNIENE